MRYPVDDEFAIELTTRLYELLADKGQPVGRAAGMTLRRLSADPRFSALSIATPALFGGQAATLRLAAPERQDSEDYDPSRLKLPGLPPQPDRFVGRTRVMAEASEALAAGSGIPGVLLHGMPGGGKTACALELAYTHEHAFDRLVWCKAPDEGADITGSLTDFALTLERCLPGFQMAHLVHDANQLTSFLPQLTELTERRRLLLVVDNAESLLTESGQWRDDNWGRVIGALAGHRGLGRLILTSRWVPARLTGLRIEAVDALSADEALLLARELPNLRRLIADDLPGIDAGDSRRLALGVLNVAQGHPKLLELADGQAAHPDRLAALIEAADQAWREQGGLPDGFFVDADARAGSASTASTGDYWHVLAAWTNAVADILAPGERDLFCFLCCLEEPDRERWILDTIWPHLWEQLGRDGEPPSLDEALASMSAVGLAAIRPGASAARTSCTLYPGVAAAGRARAGTPFWEIADAEAAAFWNAIYWQVSGKADGTAVRSSMAVRAGMAAVPYLVRQQEWTHVATLIEGAFNQAPSRANAAAMLPAIQQAVRHSPSRADVLALVLEVLDPGAAEIVIHDHLAAAVAAGDYRAASATTGRLADLLLRSGRPAEALKLAEQRIGYSRRANLGPWTQLYDKIQRLQVLTAMGQADPVLAEVIRLRDHMAALPAIPGPDEVAVPWHVREVLFHIGHIAARQLSRWEEALAFSAALVASKRERAATPADIANTAFNDYLPLLRLGHVDQAMALLQDCLRVFQDAHDTMAIGSAFGALADIEDQLGPAAVPPTSAADLDRQLGDIPGTALPRLIARLSPDAETAEQALGAIIAKAQELAATATSGDH
jgi:tetratricopeptide (TPR) repeat protein